MKIGEKRDEYVVEPLWLPDALTGDETHAPIEVPERVEEPAVPEKV